MSDLSLDRLLTRLAALFERERLTYMVMGGIAVRFWALPRPTFDLDFTVALAPAEQTALVAALDDAGFSIPEPHRRGLLDTLQRFRKFSVQWFEQGREIAVDLFVVTTAYQRLALARRIRVTLDETPLWMITPEDLILHKLIAGRPRDRGDVGDVLVLHPAVDMDYLRHWAAPLGVAAELEQALTAADRSRAEPPETP